MFCAESIRPAFFAIRNLTQRWLWKEPRSESHAISRGDPIWPNEANFCKEVSTDEYNGHPRPCWSLLGPGAADLSPVGESAHAVGARCPDLSRNVISG